jgi:hypothetical protein
MRLAKARSESQRLLVETEVLLPHAGDSFRGHQKTSIAAEPLQCAGILYKYKESGVD